MEIVEQGKQVQDTKEEYDWGRKLQSGKEWSVCEEAMGERSDGGQSETQVRQLPSEMEMLDDNGEDIWDEGEGSQEMDFFTY
jgi:hypothetical protein